MECPAAESDDALAHNLANFLRTLALPEAVSDWSDDNPARPAGEDRRWDRPARAVDNFPDGRGHGAARHVPANPRRHNGAASIAAGPMLRGARLPIKRWSHRRSRDLRRCRGSTDLAERAEGQLSFTEDARMDRVYGEGRIRSAPAGAAFDEPRRIP
jgi:hypothetical protein